MNSTNTDRTICPRTTVFLLLVIMAAACSKDNDVVNVDPGEDPIFPGQNAHAEIQEALINADPGDTITLGEGTFELTASLSMDGKTDVTLKGTGRGKTLLSFADQTSGSEGLLVTNSNNIIVRDLAIVDAAGDALKFRNSNGIVMYRVDAIWSGDPSEENGSYGLYPVLSSNILIDDCYTYGASDAGIYVGQSDKAIVRNSKAEGNVAGIEIENTTNADVYNNTVTDNTGGILVFDLPGLSQSGSKVRVFDNTVLNNGRENFAPAGSIVSEVAAGTGIMVLSTDEVEIFGNEIEENNVIGTGVFSVNSLIVLGVISRPPDTAFNPGNIYIHNNNYSRSNTYIDSEQQPFIGKTLVEIFGESPVPDIIVDGYFAADMDESGSVCIEDNSGNNFANLNIPNDFPGHISFDSGPHNCSLESLGEVVLDIPDFE